MRACGLPGCMLPDLPADLPSRLTCGRPDSTWDQRQDHQQTRQAVCDQQFHVLALGFSAPDASGMGEARSQHGAKALRACNQRVCTRSHRG